VFHFHLHGFSVLQRCGEDVLGCNFFKWCYEEGADERDAIIARQRQKIAYMENSLSVWKKRMQLSLVLIMCSDCNECSGFYGL